MATDYESLIPSGIADQAIAAAEQESVVLALGNVIRMGAGVESIPVVSVAPSVGFVSPAYGGRKPITQVEWSAERLEPVEIAATLAIPDAFIDDSGLPGVGVRSLRACEVGREGARPGRPVRNERPARVPGRWHRRTRRSRPDWGDGGGGHRQGARGGRGAGCPADRHRVAGLSILAALRQSQMASGLGPVSAEAASILFGLPVETTVYWDATKGDALVGDWAQLVIGIREDITYELSTDGVLVDPGGVIQVSAFQDDMTLLRVHLRVPARPRWGRPATE